MLTMVVRGWGGGGLGVLAGERPVVQRIMQQEVVKVLPWSGSGARLRKEVGTAEACTARVAASLVACALIYQNSIEVASAAALYWAWAPIWSTVLSNSLLRLRYRYAGIWRARVLEVQVVPPLELKEESGDLLGSIFNKLPVVYPTLQLLIGDNSPATFQMDVVMTEEIPRVKVGERVEVLVMSDRPSLSRFKALRDVYLPDRDVWISEEPYIERECFERLLRNTPSPVVRDNQGIADVGRGKLYLEENSTNRNSSKWGKAVKSRAPEKQSRLFPADEFEMDYQDDKIIEEREPSRPVRTKEQYERERRAQKLDEKDLYL
ncbi:hypothetical protein Mapa_004935 [Marchantia paleacea]|nr:hypothetical protein Mapa_004935 [Marchantia paleacea]